MWSKLIIPHLCDRAKTLNRSRIMSSCSVFVVYRPGSAAVTATFFCELADVLDRFSTYVEPLVFADDINIRLERSTDPHTVEF